MTPKEETWEALRTPTQIRHDCSTCFYAHNVDGCLHAGDCDALPEKQMGFLAGDKWKWDGKSK